MSRPEYQLPPQFFYNEEEAAKYASSTRIQEIQIEMSQRALELLAVTKPHSLLLDIGCGTGLSGATITENGHAWVGMDISKDMLNMAQEIDSEGDLYLADMGQGLPFRSGIFDGAISISALQWLCVAGKKSDNPYKRIAKFFQQLYFSLAQGGRAVLQFYPDCAEQIDMITKSALKAGFVGSIIVDFPNSQKAKKMYLVLDTSGGGPQQIMQLTGKETEEEVNQIKVQNQSKKIMKKKQKGKNKKPAFKSKEWILQKKEKQRQKGLNVRKDNKFTGRKRNNLGMFG